jgi:hypothetical protein
MPVLLHEPAVRDSIRARVQKLTPSATRAWGKMSVDQMLWHVNKAMSNALGETTPQGRTPPIPLPVLRFLVLNLPWGKGAPTAPDLLVATERYDFDAEKTRCLALIDQIAAKGMDASGWGKSSLLGQMSGRDWSRLQAKHLNHHLKQFSV